MCRRERRNNELNGEIPPEIRILTNLTYIVELRNNELTGEIPPEIGNLRNLTYMLDLRNNELTGEILPVIGNLTNLPLFSYTHLRDHETREDLVCPLLLEKKHSTYTCAFLLHSLSHPLAIVLNIGSTP